jgi:hypothetical protein
MDPARVLLDAAKSPLADPVARLDPDRPPPPDVAAVHAAVRAAVADAIDAVADERRAQMVLVTGEPGMGKTHQLAWLRARSEGRYACVDIPPLKDAGAPFGHLARYVVQGLAAGGQLDRLLWGTLRRIAAAVRADADENGDDALRDRIDEAIVDGAPFSLAFRALAQHDAPLGRVLYQRGRRLAPLSTLPADFGRVLCRITDRDAEPAIIDWLRAAELPADDLELLDVKAGLETEDRAFEVLRALALCAPRPLVLCLDQLESTAGLLGSEGVARLFTALMELYQQAPVCIVLMCQTQQWVDLRRDVPAAAVQRIAVLPPLAKPTALEAAAIVASRLEPLWRAAGAEPPYPSWPFSPEFIAGLVETSRPTIRQVLLECDARLADMRRGGRVVELAQLAGRLAASALEQGPRGSGPGHPRAQTVPAPLAPDGADVEWIAALRAAHDRYARAVAERRDLGQPKFRQEQLREAILDVLRGAARFRRPLGDAVVTGVTAPRKPRNAPRPPAVIGLDGPDGTWRLALEVHSDEARFAYHVLERLRAAVDDGTADAAVLIREADMPLGDGARRSLEVAGVLAERGGGVVYLESDAAVRLVGAELLLDAAQAAEVLIDGHHASRNEALEFVLDDENILGALAAILMRPRRGASHARHPDLRPDSEGSDDSPVSSDDATLIDEPAA